MTKPTFEVTITRKFTNLTFLELIELVSFNNGKDQFSTEQLLAAGASSSETFVAIPEFKNSDRATFKANATTPVIEDDKFKWNIIQESNVSNFELASKGQYSIEARKQSNGLWVVEYSKIDHNYTPNEVDKYDQLASYLGLL